MPTSVFAQATDTTGGLEEVLVTASKRGEQSLLNTPMAIQAITSAQLEAQGIHEFGDFARSISGLAFTDQGPGDKKIVLRGLDSVGAATTGLYFDDIVVTANNPQDGGGRQPDFRLVDMERIEVLKGPQGTLYGASSMSGTVRMLTNKPDLDRVSSAFNGGIGSTDGAAGANHNLDAMFNLPLVEGKLAARVVGYQNDQRGWIDNPYLGMRGVNNQNVRGGRAALRWQISDDATLDAMYVHQTLNTDGPASYQPLFGKHTVVEKVPTPWSESMDAYNLAFNWNVAAGTVSASLSKIARVIDYRTSSARVLCSLSIPATSDVRPTCYAYDNETLESFRGGGFQPQNRDIISSEVRYASAWQGPVQLIGGLFYAKESGDFLARINFLNTDNEIQPQPQYINSNRFVHNSVEQKAAFGELNYSITDALTLTAGARVFEFDVGQRSQNLVTRTRPVAQPVVITNSTEKSSTFKGSLQYQFTPTRQLYFTFSQGFRSGGNNEPDFATGTVLPPYQSDSLNSYELGGKGRFLNGAIDMDLAIYEMEWSDLQQRISAGIPGSSVLMIANVGSARIRGGEFGLQAKPIPDFGLLVGLNATVMRDVITEAVAGINHVGDRVPNVPKFSTNAYLEYDFPVLGWNSSARVEYQYVGDSYNEFSPDFDRLIVTGGTERYPLYTRQGDYSLVNLRLNFDHDNINVGAYATNIFNTNGLITATFDYRRPTMAFATQPRTVGLTLGYKF